MGVKDLWTILVPVRRENSLEDLAGKTLAVDLSGWVCQADGAKVLSYVNVVCGCSYKSDFQHENLSYMYVIIYDALSTFIAEQHISSHR